MSWIGWAATGILAVNVLFFGTLLIVHIIEGRKRNK